MTTNVRALHTDRSPKASASERTLWFGVFAGPASWSAHLLISYPLSSLVICDMGWTWLLHGISVAMALVALAGMAVSWRSWRRIGDPAGADLDGTGSRRGFMAFFGILFSLIGVVGILLAWIPIFLIDPCEGWGR